MAVPYVSYYMTPNMAAPYIIGPYTAAPQPGAPYKAGKSTVFPVTFDHDFTPESVDSPARLLDAGGLLKGIQHAKPARLRNVLRKLGATPGLGRIVMHYLLVNEICDDQQEDYRMYEEELRFACCLPKDNARLVKGALDASQKREAKWQMPGGEPAAPIVVEDDDDKKETARLNLPPIKSIMERASLPEPLRRYNRPVLQVLPQQQQRATTNKRKPSRHVVCGQCKEVFDPEAEDGLEDCLYYKGEFQCTASWVFDF